MPKHASEEQITILEDTKQNILTEGAFVDGDRIKLDIALTPDSTDTLTNKTLQNLTNKISANELIRTPINKSGATLLKGQLVQTNGVNIGTDDIQVELYDGTRPALGVVLDDVLNNEKVRVAVYGSLQGIDTSGQSETTITYADSATGSYTFIKPNIPNPQVIGVVVRVNASTGAICVCLDQPISDADDIYYDATRSIKAIIDELVATDNYLTDELLTLLATKKVKDVATDALNNRLVITYTDDTVANLNINDIVTDVNVAGATLDATTNVLTLTSDDGGADVTVDLSDFVNSGELTSALSGKADLSGATFTDSIEIVRGENQSSHIKLSESSGAHGMKLRYTGVDTNLIELVCIQSSSEVVIFNAHRAGNTFDFKINPTVNGVAIGTLTQLDTKVDKVTSTDNGIARFDGTTGAIQNTPQTTINDDGDLWINGALSATSAARLQVNGFMRVGAVFLHDVGTGNDPIENSGLALRNEGGVLEWNNKPLVDTSGATFTNNIELSTVSTGVIMSSPNGTRYKLTVEDDGSLTTTAI